MLLLDSLALYEPQKGPVDPDTCDVCSRLRQLVPTAEGPQDAVALVVAMTEHKVYGHPEDPR